jgi:hypothetical protein
MATLSSEVATLSSEMATSNSASSLDVGCSWQACRVLVLANGALPPRALRWFGGKRCPPAESLTGTGPCPSPIVSALSSQIRQQVRFRAIHNL